MPTHWKKLTNPDYLGSYAFDPGEEKIGTIAYVREESVVGADGKKEDCTVAHFAEKDLKPLILNATNCKAITKLYKSPFIEDWAGKKIVMRVQAVKAFGEIVDAVRIKPEIPKSTAPEYACSECGQVLKPFGKMNVAQLASYTSTKYGRVLCSECAGKEAKGADQPDTAKAAASEPVAAEKTEVGEPANE